jgi:hypothetical protein
MRAVPQFNAEYAGKLLARAVEKLAQLRWTCRKVSCETRDLLVVSQRDRSDYYSGFRMTVQVVGQVCNLPS